MSLATDDEIRAIAWTQPCAVEMAHTLAKYDHKVVALALQKSLGLSSADFGELCRYLLRLGVIERKWSPFGGVDIALIGLTARGRRILSD